MWGSERTLQGSNMSGEMTLGNANTNESLSYGQPRRNRTMGNNQSQSLTRDHTGWSDDDLFVAALQSRAFLLFDAEIDEALGSLVKRWAPRAAPNAQVIRRSFKFPSAKPASKPK